MKKIAKVLIATLLVMFISVINLPLSELYALNENNPITEETVKEQTPVQEEEETKKLEIPTYQISGMVYEDKNGNLKQDADEIGVSDIEVKVYSTANKDTVLCQTLTDGNGNYSFIGMQVGIYTIEYRSSDINKKLSSYDIVQSSKNKEESIKGEYYQTKIEINDNVIYLEEVTIEENQNLNLGLKKQAIEEEKEVIQGSDNEEQNKEEAITKEEKKQETETKKTETEETVKKENSQEMEDILRAFQAQLNMINPLSAGSVVQQNTSKRSAKEWMFSTTYVNQEDIYNVKKTNDFSLKYQMNFHNNKDFEIGDIEIRIPSILLKKRDGTPILPTEIAIPKGTPEMPVQSKVSDFNYYIDTEKNELVMFNYKKIGAGTNNSFQVLYKDVKIMEVKDETSWSLTPTIKVKSKESIETDSLNSLTGSIDSQVLLSSATTAIKTVYNKTYYPGIYTKTQLKDAIAGDIPAKFNENFDDYSFVIWRVDVKGSATQPWKMLLNENGMPNGEVVGFNNAYGTESHSGTTYYVIDESSSNKEIKKEIIVVLAYPKNSFDASKLVTNEATVRIEGMDGYDEAVTKKAEANWKYIDYDWNYSGNITEITNYVKTSKKYEKTGAFSGWLDAYRAASEKKVDFGNLIFQTNSSTTGYGYTHNTDSSNLGERIEGASYKVTTANDFIYAFPNTGTTDGYRILDDKDYYFSSINIIQTDKGYNPWENDYADAETSEGLDVYAMYKGSTTWEKVATIPWDASGKMSYTFTPEQIAKEPWRVKAVHESINYKSLAKIDTTLKIRHDSPVFKEMIANDIEQLTLESLNGLIAESLQDGQHKDYFHGNTGGNNYSEPELKEKTQELYGFLVQRDNSYATLNKLQKRAASYKTGTSWNDATTSRVNLKYNLTEYDGYEIFDKEAITYLKNGNVPSPSRNDVVFYDLLPYGVKFDPSVDVVAGRIKDVSTKDFMNHPSSWDQSQVKVRVDPKEDIIMNYKGTGRTLVAFHLHFEGAEAASYLQGYTSDDPTVWQEKNLWAEGWGVSFGAYYDWKDVEVSNTMSNISAFMPAKDDNTPLIGTNEEVMPDDGQTYPNTVDKNVYKAFGEDIDRDGNTSERNVLYANTVMNDDIAVASRSGIEKLVKSDDDRFGNYTTKAIVDIGKGYSYDITVKNTVSTLKDIVVFDLLENAPLQTSQQDQDTPFESNWWYGTFDGVITAGLEEKGIQPVIYYNANREAKTPINGETSSEILTEENGWFKESAWTGSKADVKAVAVDLSKKKDGSAFEIKDLGSVTFRIQMLSPEEDESNALSDHGNTYDKLSTARYAYNNSMFYSHTVETGENTTVIGKSVQVSQHEKETLEIVKQFDKDVPASMLNSEFCFQVSFESLPFANREYQLFKKIDGEWVQQGKDKIFATDANGKFYLRADEKAVFQVDDLTLMEVKEEDNPFWHVKMEETNGDKLKTQIYYNTYRPVLYAEKKTMAYPVGIDLSKYEFTYQIKVNGEPQKNAEYWIVDSVLLQGGIPKKLGEGKTDENGKFKIKSGQIIALFPGLTGVSYEIIETDSGDDWVSENNSVTGIMEERGSSASITNIYKWKDLYITKQLTHQKPEDCTETFSFIVKSKGLPLQDARWVILNADGTESDIEGRTNATGTFSAACAGKTVKVEGLEGGYSFSVEEVDNPNDLYEPIEGYFEGTIPVYGAKREVTIINDYLKRDIDVTKIVSYNPTDLTDAQIQEIKNREFEMTIKVDGIPFGNQNFKIKEGNTVVGTGVTDFNGSFKMKDGQTVNFANGGVKGQTYEVVETPDDTYHQIFPIDQEPSKGTIKENGALAMFINGTQATLLLEKKYEVAEDDNGLGSDYLNLMNRDTEVNANEAVTFSLDIQEADGSWISWPSTDTTIKVINTTTNEIHTDTWYAGKPMKAQQGYRIIVDSLGEDVTYRLKESKKDQYKLYRKDNGFIEISQKSPEGNGAIESTVKKQPLATITNQIKGIDEKSKIIKRMKLGSTEVPEGSKLVLRVEQFDGNVWDPVKNIDYVIGDDSGWITNSIFKTEEDGKITVEKKSTGYPIVYFLKHDVKINPTSSAVGDYRIVEVLEESDEVWGVGSGYMSADGGYNGSLDATNALGFVNSNRKTPIEISKIAENSGDQEFSFILKQITRASATPILKEEHILESIPAYNISYSIYDEVTKQEVGVGNTGRNGEIKLKAGQFARLEVADETSWSVREVQNTPYHLKDLSGTEGKTTKLSDNLMVIQAKAEVIKAKLTAETDLEYIVKDSQILPESFRVKLLYSDESEELLTVDDFSMEVTQYSENVKRVTFKHEGLECYVDLNEIAPYEIGPTHVKNGVIDAKTGKKVILDQGDVVIPSMIIDDGELYVVTAIRPNAFNGCQGLTSVVIPNTITTIGEYAFSNANNLVSVDLPDGLDYITSGMFSGCSSLYKIDIPDSVIEIGNFAFQICTSLDELRLPKNLLYIGRDAFAYCSSLQISNLPDGLLGIKQGAFSYCDKLNIKKIPNSVTTIGHSAFRGCLSITSLELSTNLKEIKEYTFMECANLTEIKLLDGLESIGNLAFYGCSSLSTLDIPSSVTTILEGVFDECNQLSTITIFGKNEGEIAGAPWDADPAITTIIWKP